MKIISAGEFRMNRADEYGSDEQNTAVRQIVEAVKQRGDAAVISYTEEFDGVTLRELRVSEAEIQQAYEQVDDVFLQALRQAAANIRAFHEKQRSRSWMDLQDSGTMLGQLVRPLRRVGVYVPGGKAAYPSSVLMNVIPAQVAGVSEIAMVTPPATAGQVGINPHILVAAAEAGVTEIYRIGGAQAVAALAYGTEQIASVDKICGPGNIYVALAKRQVFGAVDIDSIAGPTDIAILADDSANPAYIAADLLSQAEHDEMAAARLVTTSRALAEAVQLEVQRQVAELPRREIAEASLAANGAILLAADQSEAIAVVNRLAPEHLEIMTEEPFNLLPRIENAGAIFLGPYSSEPVGDYFAGTNHILPTNGTARFSSPLGVDDFIKRSSLIAYSKQDLMQHAAAIATLARGEGFEGHARAVEIRVEKEGDSNE